MSFVHFPSSPLPSSSVSPVWPSLINLSNIFTGSLILTIILPDLWLILILPALWLIKILPDLFSDLLSGTVKLQCHSPPCSKLVKLSLTDHWLLQLIRFIEWILSHMLLPRLPCIHSVWDVSPINLALCRPNCLPGCWQVVPNADVAYRLNRSLGPRLLAEGPSGL